MTPYEEFLAAKRRHDPATGLLELPALPDQLFPFQHDIVSWALRRGRAAIFANTGTGKSFMELAWGRAVHEATGGNVILLAPLAVAGQMVREAHKFGLPAKQCATQAEVAPGVTVTNYAKLHHFDLSKFVGVILDESSILKAFDGKTRSMLIECCKDIPYRLCATATPAPNDFMELGNHAEFLGVMSLTGMQATFFTHDGGDTSKWRLKGYAENGFWQWMCSWSVLLRRPSDLGYDDGAYDLPELVQVEHLVQINGPAANTLSERIVARRESIAERVAKAVQIISSEGVVYGLDTGACGSETAEGIVESGAEGEAPRVCEGEPTAEQGGAQGVHARVLRGSSGDVEQADARADGDDQRESKEEVRGERGSSGEIEGGRQGLADEQSGEAESAEAEALRDLVGTVQPDDAGARRQMFDLRAFGPEQSVVLPVCGSLPLVGQGSRTSVLELQSRFREIQRRQESPSGGGQVSIRPWLIWCNLNAEQELLEKIFGDLAFSVSGANTDQQKESNLARWLAGERPIMLSKPKIIGFGMNFQFCADTIFVGLNDSFEQVYQATRRFWRFGQTKPVTVHFVAASSEGAVLDNLRRKEADAERMGSAMVANMADLSSAIVHGSTRDTDAYAPTLPVFIPAWLSEDAA